MAEKKTRTKKEELIEGENAELEAAADKLLAEADDLTEPFTLIELPPESAAKKKSAKKSAKSKSKDAAASAEGAPEKSPEEASTFPSSSTSAQKKGRSLVASKRGTL